MTFKSRKIQEEIENFEKSTDKKKIEEFGYHFLQLMHDYHISVLIQKDFHTAMNQKNKNRMVILAKKVLPTIKERSKSKSVPKKGKSAWDKKY